MASQNPSPDEFLRLFLQHERRLRSFVLTLLPNLSDADDVVQETVTLMWQKFGLYEAGTNFAAWAFCIARLKVLEFRRKRTRGGLLFSDDLLDAIANDAEAMSIDLEARSAALANCMEQLAEGDRELIVFRYMDSNTLKSTVKKDGRSEVTIRKVLRRIRKTLEICISSRLTSEGSA